MKRFIALLLLLGSACQAAEITIKVPSSPIQPGQFVMLEIVGIGTAELRSSKATIAPSNGVQFFPVKFWNDQPYLFFQSSVPGKYQIDVSVNRWRADLDSGLAGATDAKIDSGTLAELQVVVTKVGAKYPTKSGSAVLEVAGDPPLPPPPPPPPAPVTSGVVWTLVIRTVDTLTPDQTEVLANLREWTDQQPADKVGHFEFAPDAVGPDGSADAKVAAFVSRIPSGKTQPYVFVCQAGKSGKSVILWQGELPSKAETIIGQIQKAVQP